MTAITTLEVGASCLARAAFLNAAGAPGDINGSPEWAVSDTTKASITPNPDGTALITRLTADPVTVSVGGVSIIQGAPPITATASLPAPAVVAQNPAVSASITFETPS